MKKYLALVVAGLIGLSTLNASAQDAALKTVSVVNKDKVGLAGKEVRVQGKVVKVNNGIMGRNFVHVQDGSGDQTSNNLIVTSTDIVKVGDEVSVVGKVALNTDFGSGYIYPLLIEGAKISAKK